MKPTLPCLVLASQVTALGTLRCLGRAGIPVWLASRQPGPAQYSRWYRAAPDPPVECPDPEALADYVDSLELGGAVLIPGSDDWARAAARLPPDVRNRFPVAVPSGDVLDALVDKERLAQLLEEHEIPAPRVGRVTEDGSIPEMDTEVDLFLKPTDSQAFFRAFGVKAFRVQSGRETSERVRQVREAGLNVLAQEYVPGEASAHIFVDGFVDRTGRITGMLARRRLRMHPPDFGNSSMMVSIPPQEVREAMDSLRKLLAGIGYRGIFSAEFKEDARDGAFRLLEVNPRAWWYVEFAARCGVNTPWMAYLDAAGRAIPPVERYRSGSRLVYPAYDVQAYRKLRSQGKLRFLRWAQSWLGAQQPVFSFDDPGPALRQAVALVFRRYFKLDVPANRERRSVVAARRESMSTERTTSPTS